MERYRRSLPVAAVLAVAVLATGCSQRTAADTAGSQPPATAAPSVLPTSRATNSSPPVAIGAASASTGRTSSGPAAATNASPRIAVVEAAGVRQWIDCSGSGPLTVVVIPGLAASAAAWQRVLPAFRQVTRTCIYDRPGLGDSPSRTDSHQVLDAGLLARELQALLDAAGERGPYVLIGHSFGGLIARAFVAQFRSRVRGLLLAESVTPDDPSNGPFWSEAGHRIDMARSSAATDDGPKLGSMPLLVLSASDPQGDHLGGPTYGQPAWMIALWRREQAQDTALSTDSIQVIAHSGHVLQQDNPAAMIAAVDELVYSVRTGHALVCTRSLVADRSICTR